MEGCLDDLVVPVLDIGDGGKKTALVVIVNHRDNSFAFSLDVGHPFVVGDVSADSVTDAFRPGGISPGVDNFVKPVEQVLGKGYPDTGEIIIEVHNISHMNIIADRLLRF